MLIEKGEYVNKKTKGIYTVSDDIVRNATNAQDGQKMVLYRSLSNILFVREYNEFMLKFDKVRNEMKIMTFDIVKNGEPNLNERVYTENVIRNIINQKDIPIVLNKTETGNYSHDMIDNIAPIGFGKIKDNIIDDDYKIIAVTFIPKQR